MAITLLGACFVICCLLLVSGLITVVVQYFQIRKLRSKVNALRDDVEEDRSKSSSESKDANGSKESVSKMRPAPDGKKRVRWQDESQLERSTGGNETESPLHTDLISINADIDLLTKFIDDYNTALQNPVQPVSSSLLPNATFNSFSAEPPATPTTLPVLLTQLSSLLLSKATHWTHPFNFGPSTGGRSTVDVAAQLLAPHMKTIWQMATVSMHWLRRLFNLPALEYYALLESATEALFHVILTARRQSLKEGKSDSGKMVMYSSVGSDICLARAARLAMIRHQKYSNPEDLEKKMLKDKAEGLQPVLVVVTIEPYGYPEERLDQIREVAERHNCWLHLDAAVDTPACMSMKEVRQLFTKQVHSILIEDSFLCGGVKMLFSSHDLPPALTKHSHHYIRLFSTFCLTGIAEMRRRHQERMELAQEMSNLVARSSHIRLIAQTGYRFVFQYRGHQDLSLGEISTYTRRLHSFLQNSGRVSFACTDVGQQTVIMGTVSSDLLAKERLEAFWNDFARLIEDFKSRKDEATLLPPGVPSSAPDQVTTVGSCTQMSSLGFDLTE